MLAKKSPLPFKISKKPAWYRVNVLSLTSQYPILLSFYSDLFKFNNLNPQNKITNKKKGTMYDNASELYNEYLQIYFDEYRALSDA